MIEASLSELTLRKYEKPYQLSKRDLVKKICLSLGLLQKGDSRDIVVDILLALLDARKEKKMLNSKQIKAQVIEIRKKHNLELKGIAESNIRRQLRKMSNLFLIEKIANKHRVTEFESLGKIFNDKIEKFMLQEILERIKEYLNELEKIF